MAFSEKEYIEVLIDNKRSKDFVNNIFSPTGWWTSSIHSSEITELHLLVARGSILFQPLQTHCGQDPSAWLENNTSTWIQGGCEVWKEGLHCHCSFMPGHFGWKALFCVWHANNNREDEAALYATSCHFLSVSNTKGSRVCIDAMCTDWMDWLNNDRINLT